MVASGSLVEFVADVEGVVAEDGAESCASVAFAPQGEFAEGADDVGGAA